MTMVMVYQRIFDLPTKSLGLQIVRTLIEGDMNGSFDLYNDNGVHAKIAIPINF